MIYLLIFVIALILIFAVIIYCFFSIAFVKHNIGNTDDMNDSINKPLEKHKAIITKGIDFINNEPCKWVHTQSIDGLTLYARYFDNSSDKTVILFHGYRSSAARDFSCAVGMYKSFGFNVLLCDQRSHGRSEGKLITFGVKEKHDVLNWCEFISEKYTPKKIVLGGMSMGATTVLLSLGLKLPQTVKAVVADCGFSSPVEIIKKVARQSFKINATIFIPFLDLYCRLFGNFSIYKNNTCDAINNSDIPIMLIHGKADGFVPCEMSKEAYKSANKKSKLLIVENADHGLSYLVDTKLVEDEIKNFLKECKLY